MSKPILSLKRVSKKFQVYRNQRTLFRLAKSLILKNQEPKEIWALKDVSLDVFEGDRIAVIGGNGAGKTTLFRVSAGIYFPTSGVVKRKKPLVPFLRYGLGLNPELPVIDNIYIVGAFYGLSVQNVREKIEAILDFSELEKMLYVPVKNLSSGQVDRLNFSVFIQSEVPFFALDESIALADYRFQKKASDYFAKMMTPEKTLLMASHNRETIRNYCTKAIWLEEGAVRMTGTVSETLDAYLAFCKTRA